MKALLLIAMFTATAHAHRPMMIPRVVHGCPNVTTWPLLTKCLKDDLGLTAVILGTTEHAKLVELLVSGDGQSLEGFAVYTNHHGWHLTGFLNQGGQPDDFTVKRFEHVGIAYRFDLAASQTASTNVVIEVPVLYRQITSSFCTGNGWRCTNVVSHCEQIVKGQTVSVYDGTLTVHGRSISIQGNGTQPTCAGDVEEEF